jgi:hypothetical protein
MLGDILVPTWWPATLVATGDGGRKHILELIRIPILIFCNTNL